MGHSGPGQELTMGSCRKKTGHWNEGVLHVSGRLNGGKEHEQPIHGVPW